MWKIACEDVVRLYCDTHVHGDQLDIQKLVPPCQISSWLQSQSRYLAQSRFSSAPAREVAGNWRLIFCESATKENEGTFFEWAWWKQRGIGIRDSWFLLWAWRRVWFVMLHPELPLLVHPARSSSRLLSCVGGCWDTFCTRWVLFSFSPAFLLTVKLREGPQYTEDPVCLWAMWLCRTGLWL